MNNYLLRSMLIMFAIGLMCSHTAFARRSAAKGALFGGASGDEATDDKFSCSRTISAWGMFSHRHDFSYLGCSFDVYSNRGLCVATHESRPRVSRVDDVIHVTLRGRQVRVRESLLVLLQELLA